MRTNRIRSVGYHRVSSRPAAFIFLHTKGKEKEYVAKPQSLQRLNRLIRHGDLQFDQNSMANCLGTEMTVIWFDVATPATTNQYQLLFENVGLHVSLRLLSDDEFFHALADEDDEIGEW